MSTLRTRLFALGFLPAIVAAPAAAAERTPFETVRGWDVERGSDKASANPCIMSHSYKDKNDDNAENVVIFALNGTKAVLVLGYENWEWEKDEKVRAPLAIGKTVIDAKAAWVGDGTILTGVFPDTIVPSLLAARTFEIRIKDHEAEFEIPGFPQAYESLRRCDSTPAPAPVAEAPPAPPAAAPAAAPVPAPAPVPAIGSARAPLAVAKILFVAREARSFGDIATRETNTFPAGEKMRSYLAITGVSVWPAAAGKRAFGLSADLEVLKADGGVIFSQKGAVNQDFTLDTPEEPNVFFNFALSLTGTAPGAYTMIYTVHDKRDGRSTTASLPFTVAPPPADAPAPVASAQAPAAPLQAPAAPLQAPAAPLQAPAAPLQAPAAPVPAPAPPAQESAAPAPTPVVPAQAPGDASAIQAKAFFVGLLAQRTVKDCDFATTARQRTALDAKVAALEAQIPGMVQEVRAAAAKSGASCPDTPDRETKYQANLRDFLAMSPEDYVGRLDKRNAERAAEAARAIDPALCRADGTSAPAIRIQACSNALGAASVSEADRVALLSVRADARFETGDLDGAVADFSAGLVVSPNSVNLLTGRAAMYTLKTDFEKALADVNAALRIDPKNTDVLIVRGRIYQETGRSDEALADFDRALTIGPDSAAYGNRARIYAARGETDRAVADLDAAIRLEPGVTAHRDLRAKLLAGRGEEKR